MMTSLRINFRKNRLFAKYGHECEMANELDELPILIPGNSIWVRIKRALIHIRMVSEINTYSKKYFRSQGAIANENHRHLRNYRYIIHPFSDAQKWWEFFMCVVLFLQFIVIPIDIAYMRLPYITFITHKLWKWSRMCLDCLCMADVFQHFICGYYDHEKKKSVLAPSKIAGHYLRTHFFTDFVSSMPTYVDLFIDIDENGPIIMMLHLSAVLKALRFPTFLKYSNSFCENFKVPYVLHKMTLVLITSAIYFHAVSCTLLFSCAFSKGYFYPLINHNSKFLANSTFKDSFIQDGSYTASLYWSLILIANVGSGDVHPGSIYEVILICVIWIISRFFLVFLIGRIMQVVKATSSANHKYIEMVRQLREYMRHKQLPDHMQRRLLIYYEFRFQKSYFKESEILSTISGQLRQEIVMHSCRKLVENVGFFKNLPLNLLVRIVSCLRSEVFLTNDVIVRANTVGNSMFFIASGTVAIISGSGKEICHLEDGAHFGEIALVMKDELRVASVIAVEVCELYRLDRKEFVRAIHPYPDLLDNIQRIAADRMEKTTILDEHNKREIAGKH